MPLTTPIALALGGGGVRGAAHLGVLAVLQEAGYRPEAVAGTSIGALVAALWACGWAPAALERLALRVRLDDLFDPLPAWTALGHLAVARVGRWLRRPGESPPPHGLMRGERLQQLVDGLCRGARLEDLDRPVALVAADLRRRRPVLFVTPACRAAVARALPEAEVVDRGPLALAVRASAAIPGVFTPVAWAGMVLADGGLVQPLPVRAARALAAGLPTVAVQLPNPPVPLRTAIDVVEAAMACMAEHLAREEARHADVLIRPPAYAAALRDLERIPHLIRAGREAARRALPALAGRPGAEAPPAPAARPSGTSL